MRLILLAVAGLLAGCATSRQSAAIAAAERADWRVQATPNDRERLRDWRTIFEEARAAASRAGHADEIAREGVLLRADASLGGPIPNGDYRCRVIKVGAKSDGLLDYIAYPAFRCRVAPDGKLQAFTKLTGSQRPVGVIYPNDAIRQVFLGTLVLGDENAALQYGEDKTRNIAGYVERTGPAQWRLVMPRPHFESQLDVLELVPLPSGAR